MTRKQKKLLIRILTAVGLIAVIKVVAHFVTLPPIVEALLMLVPYLVVGYDILRKAVKGILNGQVFSESFLMAVATVGACCLGDYFEGCMVMLLYQIGELAQSYAVGKSRRSIAGLMDIRPDFARVIRDGNSEKVDPDEVQVGETLEINPGEKIPIDGIVIEGESSLDTSALTGESVPRTVRGGDSVVSGCINLSGTIRITTTREFGESTVSKILDLVENASSRKSQSENFISRFAKVYTPAVCYAALALAVLPPVVRLIMGQPALWQQWIYRALTFLVISCPCALVISIPLSFFAGIGGAGREGVLVKGSNYLEALSKVRRVAFDKTGTMTRGVFEVSGVHHSPLEKEKLLELAAHAESHSSHPIAHSIIRAWGEDPDAARVGSVQEISGQGIIAEVDGKKVAVGNGRLMAAVGADYQECHETGTVVHVSVDGTYAGHILISDTLKPGAAEAIRGLRDSGVVKTVMLTGDGKSVAEAVAAELGIDEVHAGLLPEDKVTLVEKLLSENRSGELTAFVGDGINDAPVLSRADIGIAMGALGSDAAIEAADVVLMDDDPRKIAKAIRIARKCIRIVYENIWFALGIKAICLLLGALGLTGMGAAVFADVGVMLIAVLNAMRALQVKNV